MARAVFMGSDSFSLPIALALLEQGPGLEVPVEVVGVVTRPDRPAGRGRKTSSSPVKELALRQGVRVQQPERLLEPGAVGAVLSLSPEVIVVASYGQLLPKSLLDGPSRGCLNLHPSLLPRHRGSSPVVSSILSGDEDTGTTMMLMAPRMDAGPIIDQQSTQVGPEETAGELEARLADLSAQLLLRRLPDWLLGTSQARPQDESLATYTSRVTKEDGRIDWELPADDLVRAVRAYNPWPVAHTFWGERQLRIWRARCVNGRTRAPAARPRPGQVTGIDGEALAIGTGSGVLLAEQLQLPGGRPMAALDLVRGHPNLLQARLCSRMPWS